jgi:hypothetical protein
MLASVIPIRHPQFFTVIEFRVRIGMHSINLGFQTHDEKTQSRFTQAKPSTEFILVGTNDINLDLLLAMMMMMMMMMMSLTNQLS